jgi:hypothetical protein
MYCLINLAVADMLFGVFRTTDNATNIVYILVPNYHDRILKIVVYINFTYGTTLITSLFSLVLVSLERVYATFFPFRHRTTRLRMYISVFAITWLLPLPLSITLLFSTLDAFSLSIVLSYFWSVSLSYVHHTQQYLLKSRFKQSDFNQINNKQLPYK